MSTQVAKIETAEIQREEFGAVQKQQAVEAAAMAVAAREQAVINGRYVMAERHPRNVEQFRSLLLKECERPGFAETARYRRKVGSEFKNGRWVDVYAEGPSIRMIETALRLYKNVGPETMTVHDSPGIRIVRAGVTDYEANVPWTVEIVIEKTTEKKGRGKKKDQPPEGRIIVGSRFNSEGDTVFICQATEAEILQKQNALVSKALRTNGQRLLPADIVAEAERQCIETMKEADKADPDAAKRRIIDAFSKIGVQPIDLEAFLGHSVERLNPGELETLREVYTAVQEGATWDEIMDQQHTGSHEEQDRVAQEKIASMRGGKGKKKESQKKDAPTDDKAATAKADESTAEAEEAGASEMTEQEMRAETEAQDAGRESKPLFGRRRKS